MLGDGRGEFQKCVSLLSHFLKDVKARNMWWSSQVPSGLLVSYQSPTSTREWQNGTQPDGGNWVTWHVQRFIVTCTWASNRSSVTIERDKLCFVGPKIKVGKWQLRISALDSGTLISGPATSLCRPAPLLSGRHKMPYKMLHQGFLWQSSAGGAGSIPGLGTKILHASWPKKAKHKTETVL